MVNAWTWWLLLGTAVAVAITFLVAAAFRRSPRAVGLGVLLVPVTALCLWSFGLTANNGSILTTPSLTWLRRTTTTAGCWRSSRFSTAEGLDS